MILSILIRNLNEAVQLRKTLQSVQLQRTSFAFEIVLVDNESDDDSVAVAREFGCKVITLSRRDFSFGGAINLGVQHCTGQYILLMSAHVMLLGTNFLETLVGYFKDSRIAFVRPVNVGKPKLIEKSLLQKELIWPEDAAATPDFAKREWSNMVIANCTAIRRDAAVQIPFHEMIEANEDKLWSLQILKAGWNGICHIPCYYFYTKNLSPYKRLLVDLKETKTKAEILGDGPYVGNGLVFILKSLGSSVKEGWAKTWLRTQYAAKLVRQGKIKKQKYLY